MVQTYEFKQTSRVLRSTIDLIFTTHLQRVLSCQLVDVPLKKHKLLISDWKLRSNNCGRKLMKFGRHVEQERIPAQAEFMAKKLLGEDRLDEAVDYTNRCIRYATPSEKRGRMLGTARWFDEDCRKTKEKCLRLLHDGDIDYFESMAEYREMKKRKRKEHFERSTFERIVRAGPSPFSLFSRRTMTDCPVPVA